MPQISVAELFREQQDKLVLEWVAGRAGGARLLDSDGIAISSQGLIGHLNFIHPNWVQVVSRAENDYLDRMDADAQRAMLEPIFQGDIACMIVAESEPVSGVLAGMSDAYGVPLFSSPQQSVHLMWLLRHYLTRNLANSSSLHGVFLDVLGMGILITGESGVGKSELALELISRGSGLIADDSVEFYRIAPETLEGRCPPMLRDFLEVRGIGLLNIRTIFGENAMRPRKNLKLIIRLERSNEAELTEIERLPLERRKREIMGVEVSEVTLPVAVGRNLAVLVEVAVRNHILLMRGIDSTREFVDRQRAQMGISGT
ncbi:MAG: HPr(Ser) kinase/phosphatase [Burkholderiales bacterium]|nr:HPr(Ser) kinase/phosphatase [Burkholderiales bacterium]